MNHQILSRIKKRVVEEEESSRYNRFMSLSELASKQEIKAASLNEAARIVEESFYAETWVDRFFEDAGA